MTETITGGCQCGAVRYEMDRAPEAEFCHCGMCRKATGGAFAALASIPKAEFRWTRGQPAVFASSTAATRAFCAACGSPLTFAYNDSKGMDVAIGSLDDPAVAGPVKLEFAVEHRLPWVAAVDGADQQRLDAYTQSPVHQPDFQSFQAAPE
jgi:hypothetical protein